MVRVSVLRIVFCVVVSRMFDWSGEFRVSLFCSSLCVESVFFRFSLLVVFIFSFRRKFSYIFWRAVFLVELLLLSLFIKARLAGGEQLELVVLDRLDRRLVLVVVFSILLFINLLFSFALIFWGSKREKRRYILCREVIQSFRRFSRGLCSCRIFVEYYCF